MCFVLFYFVLVFIQNTVIVPSSEFEQVMALPVAKSLCYSTLLLCFSLLSTGPHGPRPLEQFELYKSKPNQEYSKVAVPPHCAALPAARMFSSSLNSPASWASEVMSQWSLGAHRVE